MMKKVSGIIVMTLLVAGSAWAVDNVTATKHNLASTSSATIKDSSQTEICVFCHTPHNASPAAPLWNHTLSTATYTDYTSSTKKMTTNWGNSSGYSKMCLGCHDGTVALNAVAHAGTSATMGTMATGFSTSSANLGIDLSNDHPVAVLYDAATYSADFNSVASVNASLKAMLFAGTGGSYVECASCHNPHEATLSKFLIASNAGSAICKACHIK